MKSPLSNLYLQQVYLYGGIGLLAAFFFDISILVPVVIALVALMFLYSVMEKQHISASPKKVTSAIKQKKVQSKYVHGTFRIHRPV